MRESRTPALATEPLLLIHATAGAWRPVMSRLSEHHEVIALDLPGFGKAPARSPAVPDLADAVEEQLDENGLDTAYLAGSSLGGWVALELARRGRARTVTAISPIGLGSERENRRAGRRMRLAHAAAPAARPFVRPVARTAVGRTLLGSSGFQLARPWRHTGEDMVATVNDYLLAPGFDATMDWALANRPTGLEEIACPVTIAWGEKDRLFPVRQAGRFAAAIPRARVRVLPGVGHVPMSDDPDLVAATILEAAR